MEKGRRWRGLEEKQHVVTVMVPITSDSELLSCLSKRKRQINIVIRNFRLNSTCFYCLHVLFWAIQSAVTVTNASQSIVGEISELTSGVFSPPLPSPPLLAPHPPFVSPLQNGQGVKQWSKTHKKTAVINKHNKTLI